MEVNKRTLWILFVISVFILSDVKSVGDAQSSNLTKEDKDKLETTTSANRLRPIGNISSEQKLMTDLLWKYENSVRPIYNSSKPVEVALGLTLTQILDLGQQKMLRKDDNELCHENINIVRLQPAWIQMSWRICAVSSGSILLTFSFYNMYKVLKRTTWILVRLCGYAGSYGCMLVANPF